MLCHVYKDRCWAGDVTCWQSVSLECTKPGTWSLERHETEPGHTFATPVLKSRCSRSSALHQVQGKLGLQGMMAREKNSARPIHLCCHPRQASVISEAFLVVVFMCVSVCWCVYVSVCWGRKMTHQISYTKSIQLFVGQLHINKTMIKKTFCLDGFSIQHLLGSFQLSHSTLRKVSALRVRYQMLLVLQFFLLNEDHCCRTGF